MEFQSYEDKYMKQHNSNFFETYLTKMRMDKVAKFINKIRPKKILEIGCGLTPIFKYYKDYTLYTVVERSNIFCRKIFFDENSETKQLQIICGDIEDDEIVKILTEMEVKYDFVILSSVLHFFNNPEKVLNDIKKVCHENTMIYINVPNAESFHNYLGLCMGLREDLLELSNMDIDFGQVRKYTRYSLEKLMDECNFKRLYIGTYLIKPFSDKLMTLLIDDKLMYGLDRMTQYLPFFGCEIYYVGKFK